MDSPVLVDGRTASGRRVVVRGALAPGYGEYEVEIDGNGYEVGRVSRLRDGGTTIVEVLRPVAGGLDQRRLVFPNRIGSDDRTPRLDGERIE